MDKPFRRKEIDFESCRSFDLADGNERCWYVGCTLCKRCVNIAPFDGDASDAARDAVFRMATDGRAPVCQHCFHIIRLKVELLKLFESPIETAFFDAIWPVIDFDVWLYPQVTLKTPVGEFRVDLVAKIRNCCVVFECDGRQWHDRLRDEFRDAAILNHCDISAIYRLRGTDIHRDVETCLSILATWEEDLFFSPTWEWRAGRAVKPYPFLRGNDAMQVYSRINNQLSFIEITRHSKRAQVIRERKAFMDFLAERNLNEITRQFRELRKCDHQSFRAMIEVPDDESGGVF